MSEDKLEFEVFTLFPEAITAFVSAGLLGKAVASGRVQIHLTNFREFTTDRHHTVDDSPFGGGAGMVIKPEPVVEALEAVTAARGPMHKILLTPSGEPFDQRCAERLASLPRIALLCGRYEGIDDRVREGWVDECLSIGDFVLNGGEVAAAAVIEAVSRLREGVLGNPDSIAHESFAHESPASGWDPGLVLEHPHYTRPAGFRGLDVPEVLLRGNHAEVELWRRRAACLRTWVLRPELRNPWWLDAEHPLVLVAPPSVPPEERQRVAELAAALGFVEPQCTLVVLGDRAAVQSKGPGPWRSMRDLKQVLKQVRKQHGENPWVLGLSAPDASALPPERPPELVLDVLAYAQRRLPGPLVLWLGGAGDLPASSVDAWLALGDPQEPTPSVSPDAHGRLAIRGRLIDISQPLSARRPSVAQVHVALERLRAIFALRDPQRESSS